MGEYVSFDKLITPALVRVIFWLSLVAVVLAGLSHIFTKGEFWWGVLVLVLGPLGVRVYCEIVIVIFQINNTLTEIRDRLQSPPTPSPTENQ